MEAIESERNDWAKPTAEGNRPQSPEVTKPLSDRSDTFSLQEVIDRLNPKTIALNFLKNDRVI